MADGHADTVAHVAQPTTATPTTQGKAAPKAVDNGDQASLAERQREFAAGGGDGPAGNAAPAETRPAQAIARLERSIAIVGRAERPSPFGVAQFPPLPPPPARKAKP